MKIPDADIKAVMSEMECSKAEADIALRESGGDVVRALQLLVHSHQ